MFFLALHAENCLHTESLDNSRVYLLILNITVLYWSLPSNSTLFFHILLIILIVYVEK